MYEVNDKKYNVKIQSQYRLQYTIYWACVQYRFAQCISRVRAWLVIWDWPTCSRPSLASVVSVSACLVYINTNWVRRRSKAQCYINAGIHTLSGRNGSALVWYSEGRTFAVSSVQQVMWFAAQPALQCAIRGAQGVLPRGGCNQSIRSTVSDAIVRSWLWLTATRGSPFCYFSKLLQVVDNWNHILW